MPDQRIVITGARGYIGQAAQAAFARAGAQVVGLGRAAEQGRFTDLRTGEVGGLDDFFKGATGVVHLAGQLVTDPGADLTDYFAPNVLFTDTVAETAVRMRVPVLVHASSRLVYPATLTTPAREDADAAPDTPYGRSKLWAEGIVRSRADAGGTSAVSLRIAQVTGGDHPGLGVINQFIRQARAGELRVRGQGVAIREVVHIDDVADAIVAATAYRGPWRAINIGGVEPVRVAELAEYVSQLGDGIPVRTEDTPQEDRSCFALDHSRAVAELGWRASVGWRTIIDEVWAQAEEATK